MTLRKKTTVAICEYFLGLRFICIKDGPGVRGTHQFDRFCTSTIVISSTFSVLRPKPYYDFFGQTVLLLPIRNPDLTKGRSKRVEVKKSK